MTISQRKPTFTQSTEASLEVPLTVRWIEVRRIQPEPGLSRQRDQLGHDELSRSIAQFGVLTPIAVRPNPKNPEEYLLVKGQGRTLACRLLGIDAIPAIVVDDSFSESQKVQQFLVENVARLRMKPVDRALLIVRARKPGEETKHLAARFGVSAATVRKLESQLQGATPNQIAALRSGDLSLARHSVIARFMPIDERDAAITILAAHPVSAADLQSVLLALGWPSLVALGPSHCQSRLDLFEWTCRFLASQPKGPSGDKLRRLAAEFPSELPSKPNREAMA